MSFPIVSLLPASRLACKSTDDVPYGELVFAGPATSGVPMLRLAVSFNLTFGEVRLTSPYYHRHILQHRRSTVARLLPQQERVEGTGNVRRPWLKGLIEVRRRER